MVFLEANNIFTPLGATTEENMTQMEAGISAVKPVFDSTYSDTSFSASLFHKNVINGRFMEFNKEPERFTRLEKMIIASISEALTRSKVDISAKSTLIALSTTKGNIDLLENENSGKFEKERVLLWRLGEIIAGYYKNPNPVMVISNACISGVLAINTAAMLINSGLYDNAVVCGADMVTRFVVSGFMSFKSVSPTGCKPFDASRDGLSLGEAAGTVVLTKNQAGENPIAVTGGGSANDANHISGPSRTGEGAYLAIKKAMAEAGKSASDIDHISAHGTATPYNDEMESIALGRHHLENIPVNSLKGFWGHTLGAAGVIETIALAEEMRTGKLLPTLGYTSHGVSIPINVIKNPAEKQQNYALKMASGFGGTNAALILEKISKR